MEYSEYHNDIKNYLWSFGTPIEITTTFHKTGKTVTWRRMNKDEAESTGKFVDGLLWYREQLLQEQYLKKKKLFLQPFPPDIQDCCQVEDVEQMDIKTLVEVGTRHYNEASACAMGIRSSEYDLIQTLRCMDSLNNLSYRDRRADFEEAEFVSKRQEVEQRLYQVQTLIGRDEEEAVRMEHRYGLQFDGIAEYWESPIDYNAWAFQFEKNHLAFLP